MPEQLTIFDFEKVYVKRFNSMVPYTYIIVYISNEVKVIDKLSKKLHQMIIMSCFNINIIILILNNIIILILVIGGIFFV